jgi:Tfp pilus assembly protein PilF
MEPVQPDTHTEPQRFERKSLRAPFIGGSILFVCLAIVGIHLFSTEGIGGLKELILPSELKKNIEPVIIGELEEAPKPSLDEPVLYAPTLTAEQKNTLAVQIADSRNTLTKNDEIFGEWVILSTYYRQAGDLRKAEAALKYAGWISPENVTSFNNLGNLYHFELKEYENAEKAFMWAIQNDPTYVISYKNLHELYAYSYKTDTNLAADALLQGLENNPNHIDLLTMLARYYAVVRDDVENAQTYYRKAQTEAERLGNTSLSAIIEEELSGLK